MYYFDSILSSGGYGLNDCSTFLLAKTAAFYSYITRTGCLFDLNKYLTYPDVKSYLCEAITFVGAIVRASHNAECIYSAMLHLVCCSLCFAGSLCS